MSVPTKNNTVQPLNWQRPIVAPGGAATDEFQRAWAQQARTNASIPDLTTAAAASEILDLISSTAGSLLVRGSAAWGGLASPSDTTKFLNGSATPAWAQVTDADLSLSNITTNNVSTTKHGFAPKAPNDATKYLDGTGAYSTPSSGSGAPASIQDTGTAIDLAISDSNGQLVLDGSGNPIFAPEVFPAAAIPSKPVMTMQVLTSGTTYTPTAGATWIKVRAVAGGGGGGGSSTTTGNGGTGGNGGTTTFNGVNAVGGTGGAANQGFNGGTGGTGSANIRIGGGSGCWGLETDLTSTNALGGNGGNSMLGGSGIGQPNARDGLGGQGYGSGGGGGGCPAGATSVSGAGGSAGEYFELILVAAAYSYAIGAAGTQGAAGSGGQKGGLGAPGVIIVEEHYT